MELSNSSILILTSMHRSGSSLTASLLQSAGLHIGQQLMAANHSNVKGYFENLDFLNFHKAVLRSHEMTDKGWTLQETIEVDDRFVEAAKEIVERNAISPVWGWKDPRTTLFLEFWANLLPQAKFLLIYRSPWEVVDSLYRRHEDKPFQRNPDLAVKLWLSYNRKILQFYDRFVPRCLLASIYTIVGYTEEYIQKIDGQFNLNLTSPEVELYEPALLEIKSAEDYRASLINHYFPEAIQLYQELERKAWSPKQAYLPVLHNQIKSKPYRFWALQDWVKNRELEFEMNKLRSENKQNVIQLKQVENALNYTQIDLTKTEKKLEASQADRELMEEELENTKAQLNQTEETLKQSQTQLHQLEKILEDTQTLLIQTEEKLKINKNYLTRNDIALKRLQFEKEIAKYTRDTGEIEYQLLVWDAWCAYGDRNYKEMVQFLQRSLSISPFSRSETMMNWLDRFKLFSQNAEIQFSLESLIALDEWQQLIRSMMVSNYRHFLNNSQQ